MFEYLAPQLVELFGKIGRCGLGGDVSPGWVVRFQKTGAITNVCLSLSLLADQDVSSQLFLLLCLCSTIKDSIASETISPNETLSFIRGYLGVPSQK